MVYNLHIQKLKDCVISYFSLDEKKNSFIQIQETKKEFDGDWTIVVFPLVKFSDKNLHDLSQTLGEFVTKNCDFVKSFNVVSGFLNLEFSDEFWINVLKFSFEKDFEKNTKKNKSIVLESCSPNTNKPLHLGHLRNILLGQAMANILIEDGYDVHKVQIVNDRGIHICKSMLSWIKFGQNDSPEKSNLKGDFFVGKYYVLFEKKLNEERLEFIRSGNNESEFEKKSLLLKEAKDLLVKWELGDGEVVKLWKKMNDWVYDGFKKTYDSIGANFDKIYYESETYITGRKLITDGLEKKLFYKKNDGSIWVNLKNYNIDDKLLLRKDGTAVYITQDIGTASLRYDDYGFDKMIYVVGNEQNHHFNVLFKILKKMNFSWSKNLFHMSYGMVALPHGKMKSREGNVIDIDDLIKEMHSSAKKIILSSNKSDLASVDKLSEMIGNGALKYFILKPDAKKDVLFNPNESIDFNGHTGPFIQYTYARICSIVEKKNKFDIKLKIQRDLEPEEKKIIKSIMHYPNVIKHSSETFNPSVLANYLFNLAKSYNHFYQKIPILNCDNVDDVNFRVTLSKKVSVLIKRGMNILGINLPSKM